ncbi:hypothetical protein PYCC9005_005836 [Savitreella phatthalungensis]
MPNEAPNTTDTPDALNAPLGPPTSLSPTDNASPSYASTHSPVDSFFPDVSTIKEVSLTHQNSSDSTGGNLSSGSFLGSGSWDGTKPRFVPFGAQVAGHDGVLSDENGLIVIKPCTDQEISWYERCLSEAPALADCMPAFMGVLELKTPETIASIHPDAAGMLVAPPEVQRQAAQQGIEAGEALAAKAAATATEGPVDPDAYSPPQSSHERAVVLENLVYGYTKPCILDLKLGRTLTSPDAPKAKQERLAKVAASTTTGSLGVRIAGMRVWRSGTERGGWHQQDRHWGKTLDTTTVYTDGILGFFDSCILPEQKRLIASRMLADVQRCIAALQDTDCRIYSPSLLFVYEGDQAALNTAIEDEGRQIIRDELGHGLRPPSLPSHPPTTGHPPSQSTAPASSRADDEEDDDHTPLRRPALSTQHTSYDHSITTTSSSPRIQHNLPPAAEIRHELGISQQSFHSVQHPHEPKSTIDVEIDETIEEDKAYDLLEEEEEDVVEFCSCRLIDFAHAKFTPGDGPDHNILDGLLTARRFLRRYLSGE